MIINNSTKKMKDSSQGQNMKGKTDGSILEKFGIVITHSMWKINNNIKIAPSSKCSNVILIAQNATTRNP
jgi:hypothetical protein